MFVCFPSRRTFYKEMACMHINLCRSSCNRRSRDEIEDSSCFFGNAFLFFLINILHFMSQSCHYRNKDQHERLTGELIEKNKGNGVTLSINTKRDLNLQLLLGKERRITKQSSTEFAFGVHCNVAMILY